jgi:DNA-binding NtrC family response regulator
MAQEGRTAIQAPKILIVDDEFLIRWSLSQALSHEGYDVISVEDGKKALEVAKTHRFDFVITDLFMPESDGWEVLEAIRRTTPQPHVIVITAHGNHETKRTAVEKGAWAYVEKPYLIESIKELLKGSSRTTFPTIPTNGTEER